MYDELIEELRRPHADCNPWALMEQAADAIEELDMITDNLNYLYKTEVPKWIPVAEKLPDCFCGEEIGNVEWISRGTVYAGCFGRGGKFRDAYFRVWNDATEGIDAIDAEYWRFVLLPEPSKEEA